VERYINGPRHLTVVVDAPEQVAALAPDLVALARATRDGVSCFAGSGLRWKTRHFAPAVGVNEDPATGSAAGPIACHLLRHGRLASGDEIEISQGSEIGRPSVLYARVRGTREKIDSVEVGGSAVVVARGEFRLNVTATEFRLSPRSGERAAPA